MSKGKVPRVRIHPALRIKWNAYAVLERAVEEGLAYGWQRAHKHTDKPSEDTIRCAIAEAVMNAIGEVMMFE